MSTEVSTLSNGLTVVTDTVPHLETTAMGVWVRTGTRDEAPEEHGLSHLLEHMAFKGTRRRTARMIAEEIENVGGDLNAATSHETTGYFARVLKDDVPLALDILADILRDSVFDPEEFRREQHVILQEIGATQDNPEDLVDDFLQEAAFADQPLGRTILGTPEIVRSQTPESLARYQSAHYRAPNTVIAAAGAVDHGRFVKDCERLFGDLDADLPAPPAPGRYTGGEKRLAKPLTEAHVMLGFAAPSFLDEGHYATRVAAAVLGGGMSSRLFQHLREERGLCYAIQAFSWAFSDTGLFGIAAATEEADLQELVRLTTDEVLRALGTVDDGEVARARAQLKASLLMGLESSALRAEQIVRQTMFLGRPVPMSELVERIDRVDAARVRQALASLLASPVTLAAVGPVENLESVERIAERLGSDTRCAV